MMHRSLILSAIYFLGFCWLGGVELGLAQVNHDISEVEKPYRAVMHEAVEGLQLYGVAVSDPPHLPPLVVCGACLSQREAFGAFTEQAEQVIVPDHFDVTTLEGRSILVHEYGHFLLTKAGVPAEEQEKLCLALGNRVYQKFFTAALN